TTSPIPNHQPPIQTYTAAETNIEKRNLNLSRTTPNLARNAPIAAIGAQSLRKSPRQSKPFGWIGSYWRHSCGYCSMSPIVPTGIGSTATVQEPRPIQLAAFGLGDMARLVSCPGESGDQCGSPSLPGQCRAAGALPLIRIRP